MNILCETTLIVAKSYIVFYFKFIQLKWDVGEYKVDILITISVNIK